MGYSPESTYIISLFAISINNIITLWFIRRQLGFSLREIVLKLYSRIILTVLIAITLPIILYLLLPSGWPRLIVIVCSSVICSSLTMLFIGCSKKERSTIIFEYVLPRLPLLKKYKSNETIGISEH